MPADSARGTESAEEIRIVGTVQGVGFRPAVYRLATERRLRGTVRNDPAGVCIRVAGPPGLIDDFVAALRRDAPPLAHIERIDRHPIDPPRASDFRIIASGSGEADTVVAPDAAVCAECLADIQNPDDRRYRYPFTNCTHCGPRLSIVHRIPYDRQNTSMARFALCESCAAEYRNAENRRFHAQPIACADCGPRVWLEDPSGNVMAAAPPGDVLTRAAQAILGGQILALKGLGGFQLACDATNRAAVTRLRRRKRRDCKPFALMARDLDVIEAVCLVDAAERDLLTSDAAPIVLLRIANPDKLAAAIAPQQHTYGFMLPYTPLHQLLLQDIATPIVLTSGNHSDEPQCIDDREARDRLGVIADLILFHDREIVNRVDDSVARVVAGVPRMLRRARGCAPRPVPLPEGFDAPPVLACGGELKNTFCMLGRKEAVMSQHIGDLEHASAFAAYQRTLDLYRQLLDQRPGIVAVDAHPEYLSSKLGRSQAAAHDLPLIEVQHHHAHIAACLVENGVAFDAEPVLGIALDGLGFGEDRTLWGGEFLCADYRGYQRLASMQPVVMPGGGQAIREPWRMLHAHLRAAHDGAEYGRFSVLDGKPLAVLDKMMASDINCPVTTSCGRLFDAVAAAVGLIDAVSYEGQAAMVLEACVDQRALYAEPGYEFDVVPARDGAPAHVSARRMWRQLSRDLDRRHPAGFVAARFHRGLAGAIADMAIHLTGVYDDRWRHRVALSGGVFQNAILTSLLLDSMHSRGFSVLTHAAVPANDGGLSLGQAAIAAAQVTAG